MLIRSLTLKNLLSFKNSTVDLGKLNVLIGPNGAGKSNLIEAIGLLQAAPGNLGTEILRGGGIRQWLWLGPREAPPIASLECSAVLTGGRHPGDLHYRLEFSEHANGFVIVGEHLGKLDDHSESPEVQTFVKRSHNDARVRSTGTERSDAGFQEIFVSPTESILSQFKNPLDPTPTTSLGKHFEGIRIFREFRTGIGSGARQGVGTTASRHTIGPGGDNLALVLQEADFQGSLGRIKEYVRRFCDRFEDVKVRVGEGNAQVFLVETGLREPLSALRMSDGTLKFLCLLAALFDPSPPPLICLEEPELGMHPDALSLIAEVLVEASERVQLVVTTHSDALIDALSAQPESVLVCERDFDSGTQFKRLSAGELEEWLEHYSLGQLWRKGEIGGGRW